MKKNRKIEYSKNESSKWVEESKENEIETGYTSIKYVFRWKHWLAARLFSSTYANIIQTKMTLNIISLNIHIGQNLFLSVQPRSLGLLLSFRTIV